MGEPGLRVLHVFGRLLRGGAELRTVELAESFADGTVRSDFVVLSGLDGTLDERVRAAGGAVIKCPLDVRFPMSFWRLLRRGRYHVVHSHVHYFSGVILALAGAAGVPGRIAHFRTAVADDRDGTPLRRAQLAVCRFLIQLHATDIIAVGEGAMTGAWAPDWQGDSRCRVIYNGIPVARIRSGQHRSPGPPAIVSVASIQPLKNQLRLIPILARAAKQIPDLILLLVGRECGDYGQHLRRAAAEGVADRVRFAGEVDDAMPLISAASLLVLPSRWEGLPGAVLEACASGTPVLATDLPGTRELRRYFPQIALLPLEEDDDTWAEAAVRLIRDGREAARRAAERFAETPFTLARARQEHYDIWSRRRAYS